MMVKRRRNAVPGYIKIVILVLLLISIVQLVTINRLQNQLSDIIVFDWQDDRLHIKTGHDIDSLQVVSTPAYINGSFRASSPFNDGKTLAELLDEYVKYGSSDLYGSPRRSADIRRIHEGIDLYKPEDTPVYPVFPVGIVTEVSDDENFIFQSTGYRGEAFIDSVGVEYGKIVRILYPEGIESLYAHLNEVYVETGQIVMSDTVVGLTGYAGNIRYSGKPSHLHLELRDLANISFDPQHRLHYNHISAEDFMKELLRLHGYD